MLVFLFLDSCTQVFVHSFGFSFCPVRPVSSAGVVTNWYLLATNNATAGGFTVGHNISPPSNNCCGSNESEDALGNFVEGVVFVVNNPGTWSTSATPLPAALPLFASGGAVLSFLGWRRKRKAIAAA